MKRTTLNPAVSKPRDHHDLLRYAAEHRFLERGGLVTVQAPQPNPPPPVLFPHLAMFEAITYGDMVHAAEPVMMDIGRAEYGRASNTYRVSKRHRRDMEDSGHEFEAAVVLLCARLQAVKPSTWPPVQDDAYHAAMAHLGM